MSQVKQTGVRIWRYLSAYVAMKQGDVWLVCYPKTGSTWLRFIICNLISMTEMDGCAATFQLVADLMPSLGRSDLWMPAPYTSMPRFIKTHQPYRKLMFRGSHRVVYLLRDPRDVMVSYFHYRQASVEKPFKGTFSEFLHDSKYGLEPYFRHYTSWRPYVISFVQYEKMKQDPLAEITQMFTQLGMTVSEIDLQMAIKHSTLEQMRQIQQDSGLPRPGVLQSDYIFARKGTTKQWTTYFSDEDIAFYQMLRAKHEFTLYDNS